VIFSGRKLGLTAAVGRLLVALLVVVLMVALTTMACGGGEATTTAAQSTTTAAPSTDTSAAPTTDTTPVSSTVTTMMEIHPLSELKWPKEGLQPEAVIEAIDQQQGSNRGPIYLPRRLPERFQVPESYRTTSREGSLQSSPNPGPPGGGAKPGYILYLWNGTDYIWLAVNFAGDVGEATWEDTGIPFESTSFKRVVDVGFLAAMGAEQAKVEINGCSDNHLADKKHLPEALAIAKELVRVE
jgi:hypothetical protein